MKRYSEYKDSGIAWIGIIPRHWEVRSLSQMAKEHFISNKNIHNQNLLSLSYGKIVNKDINTTDGLLPASFDTYQIVEDGNIVLRLTDLQNDHRSLRVGLSTQKGIITSAYLALEVMTHVLPKYLYYLLHSTDIKKVFYSMGNGLRQSLNWAELRKLKCILPPFAEQQAIVDYLKAKTSKIEQYVAEREREREQFESLKQSLIANVVTHGLNPDVPMKDSGIPWIGMIPEHWETEKIKHLSKLVTNTSCNKIKIGLENIESFTGRFIETDSRFEGNGIDVHKGDIVYGKLRPYLCKAWLASFDCNAVGDFYVFRCNDDSVISKEFLHLIFLSQGFTGICNASTYGAKMPRVSSDFVMSLRIPIPPPDEQQAIVDYVETRLTKIDSYIAGLQAEMDYLKEFKQRLISDVVTGQICVAEPQKGEML